MIKVVTHNPAKRRNYHTHKSLRRSRERHVVIELNTEENRLLWCMLEFELHTRLPKTFAAREMFSERILARFVKRRIMCGTVHQEERACAIRIFEGSCFALVTMNKSTSPC